jgi:gephyrin
MISVEKAVSLVMEQCSNLEEVEEVYYLDALNRICAADVTAKEPLPPFAASVKDGFAVKFSQKQKEQIKSGNRKDLRPLIFKVIGSTNAGDSVDVNLNENECIKINTGAPVPLQADAVIQIEDTISLEKNELGQDLKIEIVGGGGGCGGGATAHSNNDEIDIKIGQDIRPIGFDIKIDETVVAKGMKIRAAQIGICATVGATRLKVFKLPTVSLVSTGNELKSPDINKLEYGQIRDSNKSLLYAELKLNGIESIYDAGVAKDEVNSVLDTFKIALNKSDVIISTGGVSMGDKDLVKDVLKKDLNCKIHFARMNMKPGKPTTFATCTYNGRPKFFFCLPGLLNKTINTNIPKNYNFLIVLYLYYAYTFRESS